MHMYSNSLFALARIFSLSICEFFPPWFSWCIKYNKKPSLFGADDKNLVFEKDLFLWDDETLVAKINKPGDLSILLRVFSQLLL